MRALAGALLLALAASCAGAGPPAARGRAKHHEGGGLHVHGETVLVVTKLPFEVHCGDGKADDYVWTYPASWKAAEEGPVLKVTHAPEGNAAVRVRTLKVDFEGKKVVREVHTLSLSVGKITPPDPGPGPGPDPGPAPDPALTQLLQAAYLADTGADKPAHKGRLAALWRQAAALAKQPSVPTMAAWLKQVRDASATLLPGDALPSTRRAAADYLNGKLPRTPDAALTDPVRALMAAEANKLAAALEAVR